MGNRMRLRSRLIMDKLCTPNNIRAAGRSPTVVNVNVPVPLPDFGLLLSNIRVKLKQNFIFVQNFSFTKDIHPPLHNLKSN